MPLVREPQRAARSDNHEEEQADESKLGETDAPPLSPRVRRRLDDAKENASLFGPVCEQGEVIQWLSALHPDLIDFGRRLELRGYRTLSSLAFLTEDELEGSEEDGHEHNSADDAALPPDTRAMLLAALATLRHDLFRM